MSERNRLKRANGEGDGGLSEDVSEAEEASDGAEGEGFRVSVDLSAYWGMPSACMVWVPRGSRRVRWLARRLRAAAALRRRFVLLAAARALPPAEPLQVLAPTDQLCVVPVEHEWQRPFSFPAASPPASPRAAPASPPASPRAAPASPPASPAPAPAAALKTKKKRRREETVVEAPPLAADAPPAETQPPAGNETLQSVKQRALALLEQVSCQEDAEGGAGRDEPDAEWVPPPLKKRRRRVRRRRVKALEPWTCDPEESFQEWPSNKTESLRVPEITEALEEPYDCEESAGPANSYPVPPAVRSVPPLAPMVLYEPPRAPAVLLESPLAPAVLLEHPVVPSEPPVPRVVVEPPVPRVVVEPPVPRVVAEPPGSPVVRNASVPRAPRLVRALSNETLQKPIEEDPPPSLHLPSVPCN